MGRRKKVVTDMEKLTVDKIPSLIGKKIEIVYFALDKVEKDQFVVGGLKSEFELAKTERVDFAPITRAEYWEHNLTPCQLEKKKQKMHIITADGADTFIYARKNEFFCQEDLRNVFFEIL